MIEKVVVSMAQLNQTAGDLEGNFKRIAEAAEKAKHSDILVTLNFLCADILQKIYCFWTVF